MNFILKYSFRGLDFRISSACASGELMVQKICPRHGSVVDFTRKRGLNVRLCSPLYQRCSRSSAKYFLWSRALLFLRQPNSRFVLVLVLQREGGLKSDYALTLSRLLFNKSPHAGALVRFYCACRSRWAHSCALTIVRAAGRKSAPAWRRVHNNRPEWRMCRKVFILIFMLCWVMHVLPEIWASVY